MVDNLVGLISKFFIIIIIMDILIANILIIINVLINLFFIKDIN